MSEYHFENLFYGASPQICTYARELRKNMTETERILWNELRNRKISNCKFRRQHPIDIFIADFYCHEKKLVIEVDGEIHKKQKEYDIGRDAEMGDFRISVIRFKNDEVENKLNSVIEEIRVNCERLRNDLIL